MNAGTREVTVRSWGDKRLDSSRSELPIRRRRPANLQTAMATPTPQPASTRTASNAPIAIRSHSHQGIDQLEVTRSTCYSQSVLICLVKFGESEASYAHAVCIPPPCCCILVGITANSNKINDINTGLEYRYSNIDITVIPKLILVIFEYRISEIQAKLILVLYRIIKFQAKSISFDIIPNYRNLSKANLGIIPNYRNSS